MPQSLTFNFYYTVSDLICAKKKTSVLFSSRAFILNLFYLLQIHVLQMHLSQIHVLQIHLLQIHVLQIHVLQIHLLQIHLLRIHFLQIHVLQIHLLQIPSMFYNMPNERRKVKCFGGRFEFISFCTSVMYKHITPN